MVKIARRGRVWTATYTWPGSTVIGWNTNLILNSRGNWVVTGGRHPENTIAEARMLDDVKHEWQKLLSRMMLEEDDADSGSQGGAVNSSRDTERHT